MLNSNRWFSSTLESVGHFDPTLKEERFRRTIESWNSVETKKQNWSVVFRKGISCFFLYDFIVRRNSNWTRKFTIDLFELPKCSCISRNSIIPTQQRVHVTRVDCKFHKIFMLELSKTKVSTSIRFVCLGLFESKKQIETFRWELWSLSVHELFDSIRRRTCKKKPSIEDSSCQSSTNDEEK